MKSKNMIISDNIDDITDPSDWNECKLPQFQELDSFLRCQICKDFLNAPVLTTCGHIFCSICIRRAINESNKCPLCLDETYESGLKKILLLDNIINWFTRNRSDILDNLNLDQINDSQSDNSNLNEPDLKSDLINSVIQNSTQNENVDECNEKLAECPICNKFMSVDELQGEHIDQCLKNQVSNNIPNNNNKPTDIHKNIKHFFVNSNTTNNTIPTQPQMQPKSVKTKQRLANLDTSMSTNKIKERMNSLHLPVNGTRNQLEIRMKEYINIYNANLDSINPVDDRILLNRLSKWEKLINSEHKHSNNNSNRVSHSPPINDDENVVKKQKKNDIHWMNKHKDQYSDLIKTARKNIKKEKIKNNQHERESLLENEPDSKQLQPEHKHQSDDDFSDDGSELLLI